MRRTILFTFLLATPLFLAGCSRFQSKPAGVKVTSNIPAKINFDGKDVADTTYQVDKLQPKKYSVKLTPADSTVSAYETSLTLFGGYVSQIDWSFGKTTDESSGFVFEYEDARNKSKAELQLTAVPDNVPVSVDGKNAGFTPLLLDSLEEGNHDIKFQAPGYTDASRTIKLVKGTRTLMTTKLAKTAVAPTPAPEATASADLSATASATKSATPKPSVKPTATPKAASTSATPAASSSGVVKKSTTQKPYVEILTTETGFLRVRSTASVDGTELAKLAVGSTVPYASASSSGWLKVSYEGASTGWVSGQYAKLFQ
ncbi:MAG: PEGA domain-containing protein [Candidatus Woesebacteria bacterium]